MSLLDRWLAHDRFEAVREHDAATKHLREAADAAPDAKPSKAPSSRFK